MEDVNNEEDFLNGLDANMQKWAKIHHTEMRKGYFFSHKLGTKKIIPLRMRTQSLCCAKVYIAFNLKLILI